MSFDKKVAIISGTRIPFVKSFDRYLGRSNQELLTASIRSLVEKNALKGELLGDVISGMVMNHPFDWNITREVILGADLDPRTPGLNIQRACGTGLEAVNLVALKIASGQIASGIAGGSDTNSDIPFVGDRELTHFLLEFRNLKSWSKKLLFLSKFKSKFLVPQLPVVKEPRTGLSMGEHCELMVQEWKISRVEQDQLACNSHQNAAKAYDEGFFEDLICEYQGSKRDSITRKDTSVDRLAKLKTAFDSTEKATLTAGNSTPLTDGASCVLLGSPSWAQEKKLPVLAYFEDFEVAAVDFVHGAGLLMAPTLAVARLLKRNNLKLQDFDYYEIHEAFAGQVLCNLKAWESPEYCKKILDESSALGKIDQKKMNIKGGSLALGHPFAATGARLVATAAKILNQKGSGRILISVCTAGGMGVAAIVSK